MSKSVNTLGVRRSLDNSNNKVEVQPVQRSSNLTRMVKEYNRLKLEEKEIKAKIAVLNDKIKEEMKQKDIDTYVAGDVKANFTKKRGYDWNAPKLIEYIKENKVRGVIKKKEYVDEEALKRALENKKLSLDIVDELAIRPVKYALSLSKVKKEKNN